MEEAQATTKIITMVASEVTMTTEISTKGGNFKYLDVNRLCDIGNVHSFMDSFFSACENFGVSCDWS